MGDEHSNMRVIYIGMAALAGSIVSLSYMKWRQMDWPDRGMTMFVSFTFAILAVPWLVGSVMGVDIGPLQVACGVTFMGAVGAPTFIPPLLGWIRRKAGLDATGKEVEEAGE